MNSRDTLAGFDYVIVGAGAAGCVLANRLSGDAATRVALIEAGPSDTRFPVDLKTLLPIGNIFLLPHARYNWQHVFAGGPGVNGREIACPARKACRRLYFDQRHGLHAWRSQRLRCLGGARQSGLGIR